MAHLFKSAVNPKLSLKACLHNWHQISLELREPPRKRLLQLDNLKEMLSLNVSLS